MNPDRRDLLPIGIFSDAAQLSLKALRLYDRLGILKPAYIDPESSYRYYHTDQIDDARLIRMMRQMDMPLATIRRVLEADPDDAEALVIEHWRSMQRRLEVARVTVQDLICSLKGVSTMTLPLALQVEVKTVPTQPIVSVSRRVTVEHLDAAILDGVKTLQAFVAGQNGAAKGVPFGIFHGAINGDSDGPIEICLPTTTLLNGAEGLTARTMQGGQAAFVSLRDGQCAFPEVLKGYDALVDWMRQNGYEPAAPPMEFWETLPDLESQMDVYWLFRERK